MQLNKNDTSGDNICDVSIYRGLVPPWTSTALYIPHINFTITIYPVTLYYSYYEFLQCHNYITLCMAILCHNIITETMANIIPQAQRGILEWIAVICFISLVNFEGTSLLSFRANAAPCEFDMTQANNASNNASKF